MEGSRYGSPDIPELASSSSQSTGEQQEFGFYAPPTPPSDFHNAYGDSLFPSLPGGHESQGWNPSLQLQNEGQQGVLFETSQGSIEEEGCMQLDDLGSEPNGTQESSAPRPRKLKAALENFDINIDPELLGNLHDGPINQLMQDPTRIRPQTHQHNALPPLQTCKTCGIDPTLELDPATVSQFPLQLAPRGTIAIARMPAKKPEKKFAFHCEYCGKGASRKGDVERHERTACRLNPRCKKTLCPSCDFAHCRRDKVLDHCKKFSHQLPA
ncbi:hypothetical protein HII31_03415 [Pseudocercospora fuligena]|uniref:C2H2-type domain-containing protein n=1 Tax=Pseudocercospora fuligena TaxID=685502 RepID=A0A8H6VP08_9PEZI|nr:hypothetical protein HII31_03415 [Pseudocercospora fuligena]